MGNAAGTVVPPINDIKRLSECAGVPLKQHVVPCTPTAGTSTAGALTSAAGAPLAGAAPSAPTPRIGGP